MYLKNYLPTIFILIGFFACPPLSSQNEPVEKPASEVVSPLENKPKIMITVILEPSQRVEIYPEIFEEVESIHYRLGESFKKGDLLLQMKNTFYESQLTKNLKGLEYAEEDLRIKDSLYKSTLISTLELKQSVFNVATAQASLDEAYRNYQATMVIAPFDGKIGSIHVRENERPVRQKSMMEIFNDKTMIAKFIIPSHLLPRFAIGQIIPIFIKDLNKIVSAKLIRIGAEINPVSSTVNLEAEIDNSNQNLIPGMASSFDANRLHTGTNSHRRIKERPVLQDKQDRLPQLDKQDKLDMHNQQKRFNLIDHTLETSNKLSCPVPLIN